MASKQLPTALRRQKDNQRKARTRASLLDSAASTFSNSGYHQALVSDIVAGAGVGQGTFYRYFKNKREVFEALFERLVSDLFEEFTPMSASLPSDLEEYRSASLSLLQRLSEVLQGNRELVLLFLRQGPAIDEDFASRMAAVFDRVAGLAQEYLDHAIQDGFARHCRSGIVAQALVGMGLRLIDLWLDERLDSHSINEITEELVGLAFSGFGIELANPKE